MPGDIGPNTLLVLTNAIYLKAAIVFMGSVMEP